jgi:hypothetical protein
VTVLAAGLIGAALIAGWAHRRGKPAGKPAVAKSGEAAYAKEIRPVLEQYCFSCHNDKKRKADLSLATYHDAASVRADRKTWLKVLNNIRGREMPPDDEPQPTQAQRDLLTAWIESEIFAADCDNPDPGRVTLRRLNRAEYNNTIRDLVGVNFQPADDFPADDSGYGFDNIGDVLSLPPILLEKYLAAAEKIMDAAVLTDLTPKRQTRRIEGRDLQGNASTLGPGVRVVGGGQELFARHTFPVEGDYVLRIHASSRQVGNEPARMEIRLDGKPVKFFSVTGTIDAAAPHDATVKVTAGEHKVSVVLLNPFTAPKDQKGRSRSRGFGVEAFEILGPPTTPALPETHRRIFTRAPAGPKDLEAAREIIGNFARRAFRRPVQPAEVGRLLPLVTLAQKEGESFEKGIKIALQAVLVSPHFLFRGEIQPEPNNPKAVHPINEFALASRLSYFLWSSMPDEELFREAGQGTLRKNLDTQVRRMLKDAKAGALVENFSGQWLQTRNLASIAPDAKEFPAWNDQLRGAMLRETELFFESIMREDRNILDFLIADYTFVNERLARHYGIPNVQGEQFQRVVFTDRNRGGVLTHASVLTITSNPTRTSPVKRGKWVLENLLGTPPPPPPPEVPELSEAPEKMLTGTLRQRLEQHREDPNCATCHARMDPIGFGLENFNGIGAWRAKDGKFEIDPAGKLVSGESFSGPADLRNILLQQKRGDFVRCLAEKMLTYALGRGLEFYDKCAVDQIARNVTAKGFKFSVLVAEIARSTPFQMRRGEGEQDTAASQ